MERGMRAKWKLFASTPIWRTLPSRLFTKRIQKFPPPFRKATTNTLNLKADKTLLNMNPEQFIPGLDIPMMYHDMCWASEGYLWEMVRRGNVDIDEMEKGFSKLMNFWKSIYLRKE